MSFTERVRAGKIKVPLQLGFAEAVWHESYRLMSDGSQMDSDLHAAGVWFHSQLAGLRSELSEIRPLPISDVKAKRAYIALLNRDWMIVSQHWHKKNSSSDPLDVNSMVDARMIVSRLPLTEQFPARKSELIEGVVDGARFFLGNPVPVGKTDSGDAMGILNDLHKHAHISSMYNWLHNLWNECLWNDWIVDESSELVILRPRQAVREVVWELARFRQKKLLVEGGARSLQMRGQNPELAEVAAADRLIVGRIEGAGITREFITRSATINDVEDLQSLWPLPAIDPYFDYLLNDPLYGEKSLTLDVMLRVWCLLESIAFQFQQRMPADAGVHALGTLYQYAPLIHRSTLIKLIGRATNLPGRLVQRVLALLTFRDHRDDLWLRPLVPIGNSLIPVIPVLRTSNLMRLLEGWLKETGYDLASRGGLFEEYCRNEAGARLRKSPLAGIGKVVGGSVTVKGGARHEQIDLVFQIGHKIVIAECKCCLFPVSANERYNVLSTYADAAAQAKRKSEFCMSYPEAFCEASGLSVEGMEFVPIVISSTTAYIGHSIDGVPVVDMRIVTRFFDGVWEMSGLDLSGAQPDIVGRQTRLYVRPSQADASLVEYFKRPPQVFDVEPALDARPKDLPVTVGGKRAIVLSFEVVGDKVEQAH